MSDSITNVCGCPEGTILDPENPTRCIGTEEIPATGSGSLILQVGFKYSSHNSLGAVLYEDVTAIISNPLRVPMAVPGTGLSSTNDGLGAPLIVDSLLSGDPWQTPYGLTTPSATDLQNTTVCGSFSSEIPPAYGRLGAAGVLGWDPTAPNGTGVGCYYFGNTGESNPDLYKWHGFEYCLEVAVEKQYIIAVAANNYCRFFITLEGQQEEKIFEQLVNTLAFKYLRLFPIILPAGNHKIRVEGADNAAGGAWVAEIYDQTAAQIQNINSVSQLESSILFSTKDFIGNEVFDLTDFSCPPGYTLDTCSGSPVCRGEFIVELDCCWRLTDCETGDEYITEDNLAAYDGKTINYNLLGEDTCYEVSESSCRCDVPIPTTLANAKGDDFFYVTDGVTALTAPLGTGLLVDVTVVLETEVSYPGPFGQITTILIAGSTTTLEIFPSAGTDSIDNLAPAIAPFPGKLPALAYAFETSETTGISYALIEDCENKVDVTISNINGTYDTCEDCIPKCYMLNDCTGATLGVAIDNTIEPYLNNTLKVDVSGTSICYSISNLPDCPGDEITIGDLIIEDTYGTCQECLDSIESYNLYPCDSTYLRPILGVPLSEYNLFEYIGKVIRINGNADLLYTVELGTTLVPGQITINQIDIMPDGCPMCDPEQRYQEPNINFNCDIKTVINTKCTFADSVYAVFKQMRYGIQTCCEYDLDKADMRNMLLDFRSLKDPELCNDLDIPSQECCPQPCFVTAMIQIPQWITCEAPENVVVNLNTT